MVRAVQVVMLVRLAMLAALVTPAMPEAMALVVRAAQPVRLVARAA
jgi:hypothetical protein